jgi:hypothetical protein
MVLAGELAIRLADRVGARISLDAEGLVEIHGHGTSIPCNGRATKASTPGTGEQRIVA